MSFRISNRPTTVASKLGYFQMDNAGNNDTMLKEVSFCMFESLLPSVSNISQYSSKNTRLNMMHAITVFVAKAILST
jgi:hypothetical protein